MRWREERSSIRGPAGDPFLLPAWSHSAGGAGGAFSQDRDQLLHVSQSDWRTQEPRCCHHPALPIGGASPSEFRLVQIRLFPPALPPPVPPVPYSSSTSPPLLLPPLPYSFSPPPPPTGHVATNWMQLRVVTLNCLPLKTLLSASSCESSSEGGSTAAAAAAAVLPASGHVCWLLILE